MHYEPDIILAGITLSQPDEWIFEIFVEFPEYSLNQLSPRRYATKEEAAREGKRRYAEILTEHHQEVMRVNGTHEVALSQGE